MKKTTLFTAIAALSFGLGAFGAEEKKSEATKPAETKEQTHCPVMQRSQIDKNLWIDVKGKRLYVCCKGCINQIKANPDKYIKRLEDKGVVFEKAPEPKKITSG